MTLCIYIKNKTKNTTFFAGVFIFVKLPSCPQVVNMLLEFEKIDGMEYQPFVLSFFLPLALSLPLVLAGVESAAVRDGKDSEDKG